MERLGWDDFLINIRLCALQNWNTCCWLSVAGQQKREFDRINFVGDVLSQDVISAVIHNLTSCGPFY